MRRSRTLPPDWHVPVIAQRGAEHGPCSKFVLLPNWARGKRLLHIIAEAMRLPTVSFLLAGGVG
eukprot:8101739-Prorocentrum_lima.AAC.1